MRTPTNEQAAILASRARIRVVRAAPGSGKTWLVAEVIQQELRQWNSRTSGIAALSFTRIGGGEIAKAIGHELGHPHFVGTIDAFLFRYVVRPFLRRCFPEYASPRLVPGEWGAEHWNSYARGQGTTVGQGINVFSCVWIAEENGKALAAYKPHPAQPLTILDPPSLKLVKEKKQAIWRNTGQQTHSDAALWASLILGHSTFGPAVRAEIARRFPLVIVDELQDTGHFLGKSVRCLLAHNGIRSVLVGDPDQAIFEFNGARPDLFGLFEAMADAERLPLAHSRRFGSAIALAAGHLKDTGGGIGTEASNNGRAFLVSYASMVSDIQRLVDAVSANKKGLHIKVIARATAAVQSLTRIDAKTAPKLGSPVLNHMQRGVVLFRQGRQGKALAAARAALNLAVFAFEDVNDEQFAEKKIHPDRWKELCVGCLLRVNAIPINGTIHTWQTEAGKILEDLLGKFGLSAIGKLKPQLRRDHADPCADYYPQTDRSAAPVIGAPVQTVHGVKGETHGLTVFVCPDYRKSDRCISSVWWSAADKDREEKRIGYVAMTRTQGDLVVCVSEPCLQRLKTLRAEFVNAFRCMTMDELIVAITRTEGSVPSDQIAVQNGNDAD